MEMSKRKRNCGNASVNCSKSDTMKELIFATHNPNKVEEVRSILNGMFSVLSLSDIHFDKEIEEPFETIEENAVEKARVIFEFSKKDCFSEDTGLEVKSLDGEPGVRSARYAGEHDFEANIDKLLFNLKNIENREAQFKTIVCLIQNGERHLFEGICKGTIIAKRKGKQGFGYDSVFIPDGASLTFAEMDLEEKNRYSHRKKATEKLINFLLAEQKKK